MNTTNIKSKVLTVADKFTNSKAYKAVEKGAVIGSSAIMAVGVTATNAFAADGVGAITVDTASVLSNMQPFLNPAVTVLCIVGGIKLGWSFLKRAFH